MARIILHIDLDYFYAQVEELRHPEFRGKPIAVCMFSGRTEFSGAVATSNYRARELGIRSGMPIAFARQKSNDIVLLRADREYYGAVSDRIMEIIRSYADKFEQVSIDEGCIDVSQKTSGSFIEAQKLAKRLKDEIFEKESLTCSVGIGPNKLIAKMACGAKKPNGLTCVTPAHVQEFLRSQRISDLYGVGPKTIETLSAEGINTIPQLAQFPKEKLKELFGENRGQLIHEKAHGVDESEVEEREQTQHSRIMTLKENTSDHNAIISESERLAQDLEKTCIGSKKEFKTVSIILISNRLEEVTRSRTLERPSQSSAEIVKVAAELLGEFFAQNNGFLARRFGLRVANLSEPKRQKSLFDY